jgi:hypothetical protein
MTVTTADGDAVRRARLGDGEGALGLGLGDTTAGERLGVGSGGRTPVGELDGCGRALAAGDGFAVADAFGVGDGVGAAALAGPSSRVGVSTATPTPRTSGRRTSGTH